MRVCSECREGDAMYLLDSNGVCPNCGAEYDNNKEAK